MATRRDRHPVLLYLRHLDFLLAASPLMLSAIGVVMVYSATRAGSVSPHHYLDRQAMYATVGAGVMTLIVLFDYHRFEEWGYLLYAGVVLSLAAVFVVGTSGNVAVDGTSVRWFAFGPLQVQPSEFAVLAVILAVAIYMSRHQDEMDLKRLVVLIVLVAVPMFLVFKQPDLGTTLVIAMTFIVMLIVGGLRVRYLGLLAAVSVVGIVGAVHFGFLHQYQLARVTAFVHQGANTQGANYQLTQSKITIGSGGFSGQGMFHGTETNLGAIPNQSTDFIFTAIGEQLGFIGSAVVLGLYALVAFRIIRAIQIARDPFGRLLCAGALAFLVFSVFQNVGMTIGIMPITGIPLPFISYGGSALIAFFVAVGLVLNVEMRRFARRMR
ncbi:MAG TPA: rod shape-determining protein RodA [Acidimicrobiales bacterium]|nr:rod shape-determining protein RodA [Acidimicrobiales bacterium]